MSKNYEAAQRHKNHKRYLIIGAMRQKRQAKAQAVKFLSPWFALIRPACVSYHEVDKPINKEPTKKIETDDHMVVKGTYGVLVLKGLFMLVSN